MLTSSTIVDFGQQATTGDFDGDGDVDLAHFGWDDVDPGGFVRWLENQGGTFVQHPPAESAWQQCS